MNNTFKDYFSGHAGSYQQYRPVYPEEMFSYFASIAPARDTAWDCATGNGQAAVSLAKFFKHVIATDASENQIRNALPAQNIEYRVVSAEQSGLPSHSVDLITVAQALHWFDAEAFFNEAKRILKPGGTIAVWYYRLLTVAPEIDSIIGNFYYETLGDYWPNERKYIDNDYQDIAFPFKEVACPTFEMTAHWTFSMLLGYLSTWSAVRQYQKANGNNPIDIIEKPLLGVWDDVEKKKRVTWKLTPKIGLIVGTN